MDELGDDVDLRWLRRRESGGGYHADAVRRGPGRPGIVGGQGIADAVKAHLVGGPASCTTIAPDHDGPACVMNDVRRIDQCDAVSDRRARIPYHSAAVAPLGSGPH